jgi:hypothetical protein
MSWQLYASQLGIVAGPLDAGVDLSGMPPVTTRDCGCALGRPPPPPPWLGLLPLLWLGWRRRAGRDRR